MICATIASDIRIPTPQLLNHSRQAIEEALTITNPAYADALKHGRYTGSLSPDIEYFRHEGRELVMPRGFGLELSRILGPCVEWIDHRRVLPEIDLAFTGKLRSYQQEAVAAALKRQQGVLEASTGAGKTVCALAIIAARKQPTLILVHNVELLHQWQERGRQFLGVEVGQVGAGKCDVRPVTVGIVNSVRTRLEDLVPHFGHIVVDECHRCPSAMFTECASAFDANYLLGLSATPFRRDGLTKVIHFYLGPVVHCVDQAQLRNIGAVLRPEIVARETGFVFDGDASEQYQSMLTALVEDRARNELIDDDVQAEVARGTGTVLVVSDRVAHLEALNAALTRREEEMVLLTGQTPKKQRAAVVERLARGDVRVLGSTTQLIGEGFDAPGLSSLFLTTPIKFSGRVLQVVGRVLRPKDGKTPRVYDYQDNNVGVLKASARSRRKVLEGIAA
jgi:superfamily II DNA or RNA helicase